MFKFKRHSTLNWTHIIIHHSATKDENTYDWEAIDRYHKEVKGWDEIGYHFGVEYVDETYKLCFGRSLAKSGGHTLGMNWKAIGICVIGNYDITIPEDQQYWFLAIWIRMLMEDFNIPLENVMMHRDFTSQKNCPGLHFDMIALKRKITGEITV